MQILLGLGGNLGDVPAAFAAAAAAIGRRFRVLGCSGLWSSAPVGPPQPEFANAALLVDADIDPLRLLAFAQRLEAEAGRDRRAVARFGPRTLDIDLLLARDVVIESPALTLPHPRLAKRRFALLPAAELVPAWIHPRLHRTVADLSVSAAVAGQPCRRAGPFPAAVPPARAPR